MQVTFPAASLQESFQSGTEATTSDDSLPRSSVTVTAVASAWP